MNKKSVFSFMVILSAVLVTANAPKAHAQYTYDTSIDGYDNDKGSDSKSNDSSSASAVDSDEKKDDEDGEAKKDSKGPGVEVPVSVITGYTFQKSLANGKAHGGVIGAGISNDVARGTAYLEYYPNHGYGLAAQGSADGALVDTKSGFQFRGGIAGQLHLVSLKDKTFSGSGKVFIAPSLQLSENLIAGLEGNLVAMCAEDMRIDNKSCDEMGTLAVGMAPFVRIKGGRLRLDANAGMADSVVTDGKIASLMTGNAELQLILKQFEDGNSISAYGNLRVESVKLKKEDSTNGTEAAFAFEDGSSEQKRTNWALTAGLRFNGGTKAKKKK